MMKILKGEIVLASGSEIRAKMLRSAGIDFTVIKPKIDEDALKNRLGDMHITRKAIALAKAKGESVSVVYPDSIVISADQICEIDGRILDKPGNRENAIRQLDFLSGKTHYLHTATCVFQGGNCVWEKILTVEMVMKNLSAQQIEEYIDLDQPFHSCGSYEFENNGKSLFSSFSSNKDAILGLLASEMIYFINNSEKNS